MLCRNTQHLYSLESYNGEILLIEELHVSSISKLITNIRRTKLIVQGIFAKIGPDLELRGGDLISSSVDSIVFLVSPKKSYGPNSVGKNYFSATPFSLLAKNATGGHNA